MPQDYKIPRVAPDIIMETMEGVCFKSSLDIKSAQEYIGKSFDYARKALSAAEQLGLAKLIDSKYNPDDEAKIITRANKNQWPHVFRKFLQRYNPFILFVSLLGKENSLEDAARKIKVIYDIDTTIDTVIFSLVGWGEYAGILKKENGKVELFIDTEKLSAEYIQELLEAMENDIKARVYIANKLGEDVFGYMNQDEVDLLVKAIREHQSDSRDAMDDCGRAFEDFLRRLGVDKSVPVNNCKGIQELADTLKGAKLIDTKHLDICKAVNSFRIAAAHNKDRVTVKKWVLNPDAAIECILLTLTVVRSIHNYIFKQIQMF